MKCKLLILVTILITLFCLGIGYWYFKGSKISPSETISESDAIEIIKSQFPELKEYPSDKLPPKSIRTEKTGDGWYAAFVQEGSGRPIISAKCFFVDRQKNIISMRSYNPTIEEDSPSVFSPETCSQGVCSLENCHGLNIRCGSNLSDVCTEIYEVGDRCLQYAKCSVQKGKCRQVENPQFTQCKLCVQKCIDFSDNDTEKLFECESKCN